MTLKRCKRRVFIVNFQQMSIHYIFENGIDNNDMHYWYCILTFSRTNSKQKTIIPVYVGISYNTIISCNYIYRIL